MAAVRPTISVGGVGGGRRDGLLRLRPLAGRRRRARRLSARRPGGAEHVRAREHTRARVRARARHEVS